ncbi:hypothetical protein C1645_804968 [Glomus cerebriforme]|uniref:Uncharacterized protein n=1 Tax=Glomus cerebriforme TaxID=658196 RepID=A0A397TAE8_9GLOM|nr:hypothetical protein C1645_804968 [Glomus cerebriforme]
MSAEQIQNDELLQILQALLPQEESGSSKPHTNVEKKPLKRNNGNKKDSKGIIYPYLSVGEKLAEKLLKELFDIDNLSAYKELVFWLEKTCWIMKNFEFPSFTTNGSGDRYAVHMIALIKYIRSNPYTAKSSGFIEFYKSQPESKDYPLVDRGVYYPNTIFGQLLNISNAKDEDVRFADMVHSVFPHGRKVLQWKQQNKVPPSVNQKIDLPMDRMKNWLLDFEESIYFDEHLELKGRKVKIYSYGLETQTLMFTFEYNRLAQLYGIEMVGLEIMKSYSFLMNNRESRNIMLENQIWMNGSDNDFDAIFRMTHMLTDKIGYTVLAEKFLGLERKLHSFLFRLHTDLRKKWLYDPMDYYFFIFSILLGIATLIQTVVAIISLRLQWLQSSN